MTPRRISLTPEQNAILRLLEEAGGESIGAVLNALGVEPTREGSVPLPFRTSIDGLERLGLVVWESLDDEPLDRVVFAEGEGWKTQANLTKSPELVLTQKGSVALRT